MNRLSQTVARNIRGFREKHDMTRDAFVEAINSHRPLTPWTTSRLVNVEHGKGEDRAITVDELYDITTAFDVTAFELLIPDDEPGWSHAVQFGLFGLDAPIDDEWLANLTKSARLRSLLSWHPDVVAHTMPFWVRYEELTLMGAGFEEDELPPDVWARGERARRDAAADYYADLRRMVKLKGKQWTTNKWPPPDDATVNQWVMDARDKRENALAATSRGKKSGSIRLVPAVDEEGES